LSEMLFDAKGLGASISLNDLGESGRLDALLFGESQARAVIAVSSQDKDKVIEAAEGFNLPVHPLGLTNDSDQLEIEVAGNSVLRAKVSGLKDAWESAIPKHMDHA